MSGRRPGMRIDRTEARHRPAAVLVGVALALLAILLGAAPASAHDYLVSSSPAAGSTVRTAPGAVALTFDSAVLNTANGSTLLSVTGADGRHFETGCPSVKNATVSAPVRLGAAGDYRATWRIVSADGHPVSSSITFHYAPASTPATVAAGSAKGPSCGDATGAAAPNAAPASSTGGTGTIVLVGVVGGVLLVLVVAAVVVAVVLGRRRTP